MTHAHPDHAGGLAYLLEHHRPREFWWTGVPGEGEWWRRLEAAIVASGVRVRVLRADEADVRLARVLHPPDDGRAFTLNDSSLTLRLDHGVARVLLTGDIEARAEAILLATPERLGATVLKVPHHGSRTSSTPAFVAAVAPRLAVISVGADNRYRLPAPEIEARYRAAGTCVLRTDRCGAVTVETDGRRMTLRTGRSGCECPGLSSERMSGPALAEAQGMQIASLRSSDGPVREDRVLAPILAGGEEARHENDAEGRELAQHGTRDGTGARSPESAPDARPPARGAAARAPRSRRRRSPCAESARAGARATPRDDHHLQGLQSHQGGGAVAARE
jgi:hypothetical protein